MLKSGIYIANFPNYNNLPRTVSVFYSETGKFLGSVLCTEDYISVLDSKNIEKNRVDNAELNSRTFIPQGVLY